MKQQPESVKELVLQNDISQVPQLNEFVGQFTEQLGLDTLMVEQFQLAVEEAVVNVMEYAYPPGVTSDINVLAFSDGHCVRFVIKDYGVAFDPTLKEKADITLSVEERPIGGLGILLIREIMDSVSYERIDNMNVLTLEKIIEPKKG